MTIQVDRILAILDRCCGDFTFPMLDNGYVYLAATRLSLYRNAVDWAMVIEVFGFSPRAGLPDTHIDTFASRLHDRDAPERYVTREAYENYLANNPHNDSRFVHPISEGDWQDDQIAEFLGAVAKAVIVRGQMHSIPSIDQYAQRGITLQSPPQVFTFELCRYLADVARDSVLATPQERRINVPPDMPQILQLEEWHHPDVVYDEQRPSGSETFQQLAQVLATGDLGCYKPTQPPNTHWRNWPDGGSL